MRVYKPLISCLKMPVTIRVVAPKEYEKLLARIEAKKKEINYNPSNIMRIINAHRKTPNLSVLNSSASVG